MANPQLSTEQQQNANTIVSVCKSLGVGDHGAVLAIMAALQESSLRNLNYGDRDSVGLFQQRPSMGWGSISQIMDPAFATTSFINGRGSNPGLTKIKGWQTMPAWQAIQAVQRSGFPQAYSKWESEATQIVANAGGAGGGTQNVSSPNVAGISINISRIIYVLLGLVLILLAVARLTGLDSYIPYIG